MPNILCVPYDDRVDGTPRCVHAYGASQLTR